MCFQDLLGRGVDLFEQNLISPEIGDLPQNKRSVAEIEELAVDHFVTHYELATASEVHVHDLDVGDFSRGFVLGGEASPQIPVAALIVDRADLQLWSIVFIDDMEQPPLTDEIWT